MTNKKGDIKKPTITKDGIVAKRNLYQKPQNTGMMLEDHYSPCCTLQDYSPSHPWDAPGMSIRDFI